MGGDEVGGGWVEDDGSEGRHLSAKGAAEEGLLRGLVRRVRGGDGRGWEEVLELLDHAGEPLGGEAGVAAHFAAGGGEEAEEAEGRLGGLKLILG